MKINELLNKRPTLSFEIFPPKTMKMISHLFMQPLMN